jgi:hypothetical protein
LKERELKSVCESFNVIEQALADDTIQSWEGRLPDFWDQLNGLREFLEVKKMICPEK